MIEGQLASYFGNENSPCWYETLWATVADAVNVGCVREYGIVSVFVLLDFL